MTFDSKKGFPFDHQRMAVPLVNERSDDFLTTRQSYQTFETCIATRYRSELPSSIEYDVPGRRSVLDLISVRD